MFQCSSASRKFLNAIAGAASTNTTRVSVLFSEPKIPQFDCHFNHSSPHSVSVLFSEPKIPQSIHRAEHVHRRGVSVLFSEPKIPQCVTVQTFRPSGYGFSALQRAENSSIKQDEYRRFAVFCLFQCSSASRKFLNHR